MLAKNGKIAPCDDGASIALGGLMATYNVVRHWKQKMAALVDDGSRAAADRG